MAFMLEMTAMGRASIERIGQAIEYEPGARERLEAMRRTGKGCILVTAHIGNLEWVGAQLVADGLDLGVVSKPLHNPFLQRHFLAQRERWGIKVFLTRKGALPTVRHLRKGGALALIADQDARSAGIFVPFFGRAASTFAGPAALAIQTGLPIVPGWAYRTPEGKMRVRIDEPIRPDPDAPDRQKEIERLTRLHVAALEEAIDVDPGQYWWVHRRWKTRPEAEGTQPISTASYPRVSRISQND
jgi:KDO2-lipid IV(A) lauroyltransferase